MEKQKELTKRQKIIARTKASAKKFKREIKKSISTAIVAAFGFLIALSWRDVIKEYVNKLSSISPIQGNLISAIIVTIISIIGILAITKFLSEE